MILTKILDPADYDLLQGPLKHLYRTEEVLAAAGLLDPLPTEHRRWEYALGLEAYKEANFGAVLEVGGSTSEFMPAIAQQPGCLSMTSVEDSGWLASNGARLQQQHDAVSDRDFDTSAPALGVYSFVVCISVIENLPYGGPKTPGLWHEGHDFMLGWIRENLVSRLAHDGVLYLTSDIAEKQPDEYMFHWMRPPGIWTPESWARLYSELLGDGLKPVGEADFRWHGQHVYNYSFASMCLRKG